MLGFPTQLKHFLPPMFLIILLCVIELTRNWSMPLLGFYTDLVAEGELWRVVTGQFTHTNGYHLMLNCLGVLLIWSLHGEYYDSKNYTILILLHLVIIGSTLYLFSPSNYHYAGYSAAIHGFIIYGGIVDILKKEKTGWLVLIGTCLKVAHELVFGASESTASLINANVATNAHLIGIVSGFVLGLMYLIHTKKAS